MEAVFFDKVILQTLSRYLTMKEIVAVASTCRIMHKKWINRKGLNLEGHLLSYFGWKTLTIGAFQTYRKRIAASRKELAGPCIGGCGILKVNYSLPRAICPYTYCTACFSKVDGAAYLIRRGFMLEKDVTTKHRQLLVDIAAATFNEEVVDCFFRADRHKSIPQRYGEDHILYAFYGPYQRYNGFIKVTPETIEQRVGIHAITLIPDIKKHLEKMLDIAEQDQDSYRHKLEVATREYNNRKRLRDLTDNFL